MGVKSRGVKRRGVKSRGVKRRGVKSRVTIFLLFYDSEPFASRNNLPKIEFSVVLGKW